MCARLCRLAHLTPRVGRKVKVGCVAVAATVAAADTGWGARVWTCEYQLLMLYL